MAMRNCDMCTENNWTFINDKSDKEVIVTATCTFCGNEVQWSKPRGKQHQRRERQSQRAKKLRITKLLPKTEI